MHLDTSGGFVVEAPMGKCLGPEVAAEHLIHMIQHVAIERSGDADGIVVGRIQARLVFLRIDTDQKTAVVATGAM